MSVALMGPSGGGNDILIEKKFQQSGTNYDKVDVSISDCDSAIIIFNTRDGMSNHKLSVTASAGTLTELGPTGIYGTSTEVNRSYYLANIKGKSVQITASSNYDTGSTCTIFGLTMK